MRQQVTEETSAHDTPGAAAWLMVSVAVALVGAGATLIQVDGYLVAGTHLLMGGLYALLAATCTL